MLEYHKGHHEALNVKSDLSNRVRGLKTKVNAFIICMATQYVGVVESYRYFLNTKKPAIFDFNHKSPKSEMTVDCEDDFIYPYRICKIVIFVFLSMYHNLA